MNTRFSKSVAVLAIVSLLSAGSVFAANGNGDGNGQKGGKGGADTEWTGGPAHKMARMSEMLGLDAAQEDAILNQLRIQDENRAALREQIQLEFGGEICSQRAANQADMDALLASILTPEQYALHLEMQANREANRANRQGGRGNGGFECPAEG